MEKNTDEFLIEDISEDELIELMLYDTDKSTGSKDTNEYEIESISEDDLIELIESDIELKKSLLEDIELLLNETEE
jgi:hypothetical protein